MSYRLDRRTVLALAVTQALPFTSGLTAQEDKPEPLVKYGPAVRYRIEHTAEIDCTTADLSLLDIYLPIPTDWREQAVSAVRIIPHGQIISAAGGPSRVARWVETDPQILNGSKFRMGVSCECSRHQISTDFDRLLDQKYRPYDERSSDYQRHLVPEFRVQSNDKPIREFGRKIRGENRPQVAVAHDIYNWVIDNTTYDNIPFKGATYCLSNKSGACGDYSALFVATCRAAGIPARLNIGYWTTGVNSYHVWAEFLLPTGEWIPVDATAADTGGDPRGRKTNFGTLSNNRITLNKCADVRLRLNEGGFRTIEFLQIGAWYWHGTGTPKPVFDIRPKKLGD